MIYFKTMQSNGKIQLRTVHGLLCWKRAQFPTEPNLFQPICYTLQLLISLLLLLLLLLLLVENVGLIQM
jgi:hypothetical protein